jgi:chorismate mutase/prephenate dehydratase
VGEELKELREAIDRLDMDLLGLLNKRMELAKEVGRIKAAKGLTLFDPRREELIYERLTNANPGPITDESLRSIYREIFAASRLLQYVLQVAYPGPEWTYSHLAALSLFGHSARYSPCSSLEDAFDALQKGRANVAIVPIENSRLGSVGRTIDLLHENDVHVVRECYLEIAHCLCGSSDSLKELKHLYAQPHALEQCRIWLLSNLRQVEVHECGSAAEAVERAQKDPSGAAICNLYAAHHHAMHILAEHIEDQKGNTTRFFALAHHLNSPTENDKTSLLFAVSDEPGALHAALEAFARANVNMTRIESRPNRILPWQYLFFADIEGHFEQDPVQRALADLKSRVTFLKILGSYAKRDPRQPIRLEKENMRSSG